MKYLFYIFIVCVISFNTYSTTKLDTFTKNVVVKNNNDENFQEFWSVFRQTIVDSDSIKLISFVHFPVLIHGDQDQDPKLKIDEAKFNSFFYIFLQRKCFVKDMYISNFDYIKNTIVADKCFIYQETDSWRRVGNLVFEKENNIWKLVLIYNPTTK